MKLSNLIWVIVCIAIPFAYAFYLYPTLPETIPTHFNLEGKADAWGDKSNIFLLPGILGLASVISYLLLSNMKSIDPKRAARADDGLYKKMAIFLVAFLSALSLVIMYSTAHEGIKIGQLLFPLLGLFFAGFGMYMPRIKQNYFAGFRLPWTLENEENWNATHQLAGKVWVIGGSLQFLSGLIFEGQLTFGIFMTLVILMVLIPTVYSYL
ncbi:MAG: Immunity protein SdpI, partial [Bacteroidota bacterium]